MAVQRIDVLGVPVDILLPQDVENEILKLLETPGTKQIVFMNIWDLLKARGKNDYAECVREADLVLPVSKSILRGAKFLKKSIPHRYNPFTAVINFLSALENHYKSLYILGGRKKSLMAAERNVHNTFRNLQIVGRYVGNYSKTVEDDVVEAIRKSSPSLVLLSEGLREKDLWFYHRKENFSTSIFLFYKEAVGVFSERIKRVDEKIFDKGLEIWHEIIHNPLKIFLLFPYIWYILLLVGYRIFRKD